MYLVLKIVILTFFIKIDLFKTQFVISALAKIKKSKLHTRCKRPLKESVEQMLAEYDDDEMYEFINENN